MMAPAQGRRGGPLVALGAVLGIWVAARIVLFDMGGAPANAGAVDLPQGYAAATPVALHSPAVAKERPQPLVGSLHSADATDHEIPAAAPIAPLPAPRMAPVRLMAIVPPAPQRAKPLPVSLAAGHQLMWMAALSRLPLPSGFAVATLPKPRPSLAPFYPTGAGPVAARRWSADGWLLLRHGAKASLASGAMPASYGASQAGAVVRYRLSESSAHKPQAYLRLATALDSPHDKEAAAGLSLRPIPSLPVRAMAELRVSDQSGATRLRPAALVVSEMQPIDLPYEARAEFYGQAGYVGGRNATAFADGQARIDRKFAQIGKAELRAGAGAWAGAQKGASRVDLGPSATIGLPVGETASARLGLDWRMRVAGDAEPGSGLAVTLSAGF